MTTVTSLGWEELRLQALDALTKIEQRRGEPVEEFDHELRQRLGGVEGGAHHRGDRGLEALVVRAVRGRRKKLGHPPAVSGELVQKLLRVIHGHDRGTAPGEASA